MELYKSRRVCVLQQQQGWKDEALLCLALHFIDMSNKTGAFEKYLETVAIEENEADNYE
jgi:hypothetical protein